MGKRSKANLQFGGFGNQGKEVYLGMKEYGTDKKIVRFFCQQRVTVDLTTIQGLFSTVTMSSWTRPMLRSLTR